MYCFTIKINSFYLHCILLVAQLVSLDLLGGIFSKLDLWLYLHEELTKNYFSNEIKYSVKSPGSIEPIKSDFGLNVTERRINEINPAQIFR